MNFNVGKCKVLRVTRSTNIYKFNYTLHNATLEIVDNIRDLGIILDSTLSWNKHVHNIATKANRLSWLIKRTLGYQASEAAKRQLFISLVRSNIEYCTQIWGGLSKGNTVKIERIQRDATRYILNFCPKNYKERLCCLNLLPLSYRRDIADITFFHRCLHQTDFNINSFVHFTSNNVRDNRSAYDQTKLCIPYCRTQARKDVYFNRIVRKWNSLPLLMRSMTDETDFKRSLIIYIKQLLQTKYDADDSSTWYL